MEYSDYSDIIQFSRDLFLNAYDEFDFEMTCPDYDIEALNTPIFIRSAALTLDFFQFGFQKSFWKIHKKHLPEIGDTDEQFFRYVIPRGLKLVDDDNYYFSFMLVAAFICELLCHLGHRMECYRFTGVAHKCLVAVFKRRFEETFETNGGWKGLGLFCQFCQGNSSLENPKIDSFADIVTGGDRAYKKQVRQRIKQCDILQWENFILTDYELQLITIDDKMKREAELYGPNTETVDPSLEVEWTMVKGKECVKVCSDFDEESGTATPTFLPCSDSEPAVETSGTEPAAVETSSAERASVLASSQSSTTRSSNKKATNDSKSSTSSSDNDSDDDTEVPRVFVDYQSRPVECHSPIKEYYQKKPGRVCKWCKKRCFSYAKYFYLKHKELAMPIV